MLCSLKVISLYITSLIIIVMIALCVFVFVRFGSGYCVVSVSLCMLFWFLFSVAEKFTTLSVWKRFLGFLVFSFFVSVVMYDVRPCFSVIICTISLDSLYFILCIMIPVSLYVLVLQYTLFL